MQKKATPPPHPDYRVMTFPDSFSDVVGPYYWRLEGGKPMLGLGVEQRHVSTRGACHGAILAALADLQSLPAGHMAKRTDRLSATLSFTMDFISPALLGDWIEMRVDLLRVTRQFLFTQALLTTYSGTPVMRSSAVYKFDTTPHPDPHIVTRLFA